jgi:hypothetical protein
MATFFKSSRVWVVDFHYQGRPRRWFKALPEQADARAEMEQLLADYYGTAARLAAVRPATPEEETQYLRGDLPRNVLCPTGRAPRS